MYGRSEEAVPSRYGGVFFLDPFGVILEYPKILIGLDNFNLSFTTHDNFGRFLGNPSSESLMQEMEAKVSQLSANSARLAVELGTWRKHPSDKEVVTSLLGVLCMLLLASWLQKS